MTETGVSASESTVVELFEGARTIPVIVALFSGFLILRYVFSRVGAGAIAACKSPEPVLN